ncbi:MAG: hypothetical protein HKK67_10080 [Chlorobiaceae bacterium]|nr:hypothetical protein [Chlorobiaceae bacterium]
MAFGFILFPGHGLHEKSKHLRRNLALAKALHKKHLDLLHRTNEFQYALWTASGVQCLTGAVRQAGRIIN